MKVYLQYPWAFPDSTYYKTLINYPSKGIEYLNTFKIKEGPTVSRNNFFLSNFLKRNIRLCFRLFKNSLPNAHLSPKGDYDLIHCAHCLSKNNTPWVTDIEGLFSLQVADIMTKKGKENIKRFLLRDSCKKILPWTEKVKKDILNDFPEVESKIEVVYPAIPEIINLNKPLNERLKIIYVARYFHLKGGLNALDVLEQLRKKHNIEGIVVSDVPEDIKKEYPNLKIYDLLPQEELFKLMESSDIFLYPSPVDTFGFSLLEAMAFGLPIVTINARQTESRDEIVKNGVHGFIYEFGNGVFVQKNLFKGCEKLILDKGLRERISNNCLNEIKDGRFSIKQRNNTLERIYKEAINVTT